MTKNEQRFVTALLKFADRLAKGGGAIHNGLTHHKNSDGQCSDLTNMFTGELQKAVGNSPVYIFFEQTYLLNQSTAHLKFCDGSHQFRKKMEILWLPPNVTNTDN